MSLLKGCWSKPCLPLKSIHCMLWVMYVTFGLFNAQKAILSFSVELQSSQFQFALLSSTHVLYIDLEHQQNICGDGNARHLCQSGS